MKNTKKGYVFLQKLSIPAPFYFMLLLQNLNISVTYTPPENIALDCGSINNNTDITRRLWLGDTKYLDHPNNIESVVSSVVGTYTDPIPYKTARLSRSHFSYTFNVTPGQKFVCLHFYPTSYQKLNRSTAFFDVHIGRYTLLSNFSAALTADNLKLKAFSKEFCINVEDNQKLKISFTSNHSVPDSYAFINGIEIVSMPDNIYYSADNDTGFQFVDKVNPYRLEKNMALEMVYRINVGGSFVSPAGDTGMYRSWSDDDEYLTDARPSALPVNLSRELNFSMIPSYTAPVPIYTTARTMGTNGTMNENYRLTWQFQVDSGFTYLVRLHFCELQIEIIAAGNRIFQIYLNDLVAESQADVVSWAKGSGIPVYRDYAVMIASGGKAGNQKKTNLSIALHPGFRSAYSDAILNGLEIFKLSNDENLAGPNADAELNLQMSPPDGASPSQLVKRQTGKATITTAVSGAVAGLFTTSLLCFLILRFGSVHCNPWCALSYCSKTEPTYTYGPALPSNICRHFSLGEIKAATNNFENTSVIGAGGFGKVYKAFIDGGSKAVAIKGLNPGSQQGAHEFRTEIEMLSQLRHHNLVSLIGYCEDNNEMILVYDYMVHGALRDHLYKTNYPQLDWEQRLRICIGAAHGLHYLHRGPNHTIIHRDVKTTNILLGEKWVAKVSDFGLSKMNNLSKTHISTVVKGSFGYLDPEYYRLLRLTEKSDVYSFGVVLCEVLCARAPIDPTVDHVQISLVEWAQHCYNNGTLDQIIDPHLQGKINPASLKKFAEVAINCLDSEGIKRPAMSEVVCGLELALQLQESEMNANAENHLNDSTVIDYHVLFTSGSGSMNTGR